MRAQVDLAARVLVESPSVRPGPPAQELELRSAFERAYADAVAASQQGRSVPPSAQIAAAGDRAGRRPSAGAYLEGLRALVDATPFRVAPDALAVLDRLRGDGWATAVVSNTVGEPGATLRPVLRRTGFASRLDAYVFSDELPWTKPAPEIFREAPARLGIPLAATVHVGDGWVDIEGARRAGLRAGVLYTGLQEYGARYRSLFLPDGWERPKTDHQVARWTELPDVLSQLR